MTIMWQQQQPPQSKERKTSGVEIPKGGLSVYNRHFAVIGSRLLLQIVRFIISIILLC